MLSSEFEKTRRDVEFALTKQPNEPSAALDGDAYSVVGLSFFEGKVAPEWIQAIENDLLEEHLGLYDDNGNPLSSALGVSLLDFHSWTCRLVARCDPNFSWEIKIGRGSQARSIHSALLDWISN